MGNPEATRSSRTKARAWWGSNSPIARTTENLKDRLAAFAEGRHLRDGDGRVGFARGPSERFLVVNSGRTGSSLLSAVLADAGADFGMPAVQTWSADAGAFEPAAITRAAAWFAVADQMGPTKPLWPRSWHWSFARHRAKVHLGRALNAARFVKGPNLDLAVQPAAKMGYLPRIIISYRSFPAQAMSLAQRSSWRDVTALEAYYVRTYKNALMWLLVFGGCVVDYDELTDPGETEWASALSALTGLPRLPMVAARQTRLDASRKQPASLPALSGECDRLYASLRELSGQLVLPGHVANPDPIERLGTARIASR